MAASNSTRFSSTIQLANLDDFITPSQACIKPIENKNQNGSQITKVEISLGDCLACSGCVTSAETVLISQQSHEELYKIILENKLNPIKKIIVVSLSLQSIASIGAKYNLTMQETAEKLASFFHQIGVDFIYDITIARHIALAETEKEFSEKFQNSQLPVLCSVCPGWVCYVEKTHGELLVPFLSKVKSPQQIMGIIVKQFFKNNNSSNVYHVTIMPCYDKKLEATRNELFSEKEVDCVLTPIEIQVMLNKEGVVLSQLTSRKLDFIIPEFNSDKLTSHLGSGSGGYTENLFRFMAAKYFKKNFEENGKLEYKTLRNKDFIELKLDNENGETLLSFAVVNGFRNIQTLVQKIKRKTCNYHYIEVMACPSGCLNGGAQLRSDDKSENLFDKVEQLYKSLELTKLTLDYENEELHQIYDKCFMRETLTKLHTQFKPVEKTLNLINVNW